MTRFSASVGFVVLGAVALTASSQAGPPAKVDGGRPGAVLVMDDMMGGMMGGMRGQAAQGQGMQGPGMQGPGMQGQGMQPSAPCGPGQPGCGGPLGTDPMPGMAAPQGQAGSGMGQGQGSQVLNRLDGRVAFLHAELRITQQQMPAWDAFAAALRSARDHLAEARTALQDGAKTGDTLGRLEAYERHSSARLQALHESRLAFARLYGSLDDEQKRTADELVVPLLSSL